MNTTRTASIGSSSVTHTAHLTSTGYSIHCGAVRYRNASTRGSLRLHPVGTEVTCIKCRKADAEAPVIEEAPVVEAEPLTFMQKQRLAGKAR